MKNWGRNNRQYRRKERALTVALYNSLDSCKSNLDCLRKAVKLLMLVLKDPTNTPVSLKDVFERVGMHAVDWSDAEDLNFIREYFYELQMAEQVEKEYAALMCGDPKRENGKKGA